MKAAGSRRQAAGGRQQVARGARTVRRASARQHRAKARPTHLPFPQARYLTRQERVALKAYTDYLLEKLPDQIERIVLFGSKARGDSTRHSDVDLLVVVKDKPVTNWGLLEPRWFAVVDPTFDFLMNYGVYLSPTVMCLEETKQWTPLLAHVREEGVELWRRRKKNRLH